MRQSLFVKYRSLIGLVLLCMVVTLLNPRFLVLDNILNILNQASINGIIAGGMTLVIVTGGIDLSVGSILALSGTLSAMLVEHNYTLFSILVIPLLTGILLGGLNGVAIIRGNVQPFIATLATMTMIRGITFILTNQKTIPIEFGKESGMFSSIATGKILWIPAPVFLMIILFIVCDYILDYTRLGRYMYAIGSNEEAAIFSGLSVSKVKFFVYCFSGFLSALGGIIMTSRLFAATPNVAMGYELDVIAAVLLGGNRLEGGVGNIKTTVVGVFILVILNNALNLLNISADYQMFVKGLVIFIGVWLNSKR